MAKTPRAALDLLESVWAPGVASARKEEEALQAIVAGEGGNFKVAPWDWRYLAEKRRKAEFDFDEGELKPYLQLDRMIEAAFYAASRLFGLSFAERFDLKLYRSRRSRLDRERARRRADRAVHRRLFRQALEAQRRVDEQFPRPAEARRTAIADRGQCDEFRQGGEGEASLLSLDDARTLFHEFGHALHGMLSDVDLSAHFRNPRRRRFRRVSLAALSSTGSSSRKCCAASRSTTRPASRCRRRCIDKLLNARRFNQGWATVEYTASALVDLKLHLDPSPAEVDVVAFEREELARIGMPDAIAMRHRTPHFQHIFSGGYSAAYYSYLWSEVLDADGFEAFEEAGDIFDPEVAQRLQ